MLRKVKLKTANGKTFETKEVVGEKDYIIYWDDRAFVYVTWSEFVEKPVTKIAYAKEVK